MRSEIHAKGMHCPSCEKIIEKALNTVDGVTLVKADYPTEKVIVEHSENVSTELILSVIESKGYEASLYEEAEKSDVYVLDSKFFGTVFSILGVLIFGYFVFRFADGTALPAISANMGYGLLFLVGLLTGFHCISMCGGFVVSYTTKAAKEGKKSYSAHLRYATGKIISYTIIGALFGLLGSFIAFTPMMRGVAGVLAGLFLVVFGLNMLNVAPWLRKIRINVPGLSKFLQKENRKEKGPFAIGLLNGLMIACGPLQAIYIMAAGTGSMIEGAKLLFIFAVGTLPVMIGFGFIASMLSSKATHKILKASGYIVIILGLIMMNRGLALTGTGWDTNSILANVIAVEGGFGSSNDGYQTIKMDVTRYGYEPNRFVLEKGVPVRWEINGKELNSCNNAIQVPKYGMEFDIEKGKQVIEFTPTEEGIVPWSCWMGMIPGTFVVKDSADLSDTVAVEKELAEVQMPAGKSCGSGCGCGGGA